MPSRILLLLSLQRRNNARILGFHTMTSTVFLFFLLLWNNVYALHSSSTTASSASSSYYFCRSRLGCLIAADSSRSIIVPKKRNARIRKNMIHGRTTTTTTTTTTTILYDSSSPHSAQSMHDVSSGSFTEMTNEIKREPKTTMSSSSSSSQPLSSTTIHSNKRSKVMKRPKRTSQMDANHHHHHRKHHVQERSSTSTSPSYSSKKSGFVSEEELAHHVSSIYIRGPGGIFNEMAKKRERNSKVAARNHNTAAVMNGGDESDGAGLDVEYDEYLRKLDRHPALVLNADYQPLSVLPLSIWPWQETIKSLFSGKVTVVDVYPELTVRAVNMNVPLPSVIALTDYVKQPNQAPAFTRRNVFLRDGYKCQYCAKSFMTRDLSLDHVNPRCNGGRLEWTNTVTSCRKCNGKKGSTPPHQLKFIGMKLVREPRIPSKWELAANAEKMVPKRVHPTWRPFLGMNMLPDDGQDIAGGGMESFFEEDFEY